jgi:hypothetical protein
MTAGTAVAGRDTVPLVRDEVRRILTASDSFRQLLPQQRKELAQAMVNVGQYLADAGGITRDVPLALQPVVPAGALAEEAPPDTAGADFDAQGGAVAADAGVDALGRAIDNVDFPAFVADLVDGVFNAIVTSSIKQMEAFAELVKNVSKSVDAFMKDNVSPDMARDYLTEKYPDYLELDTSGEMATVAPKADADTDALPDFFNDLGLQAPVDSLDADTVEETLVPAARRRLAMDRQQVLLSMVLMGINRLIVTDGSIKAAVIFDLKTVDKVKKGRSAATEYNRTRNEKYNRSRWGWIFAPTTSLTSDTTSNLKVSTVRTDDSQSQVDLKVKLSGDVNIRFRSETFPLERMTEILGVETPAAARSKAPAAPTTPAAAPPAGPGR